MSAFPSRISEEQIRRCDAWVPQIWRAAGHAYQIRSGLPPPPRQAGAQGSLRNLLWTRGDVRPVRKDPCANRSRLAGMSGRCANGRHRRGVDIRCPVVAPLQAEQCDLSLRLLEALEDCGGPRKFLQASENFPPSSSSLLSLCGTHKTRKSRNLAERYHP